MSRPFRSSGRALLLMPTLGTKAVFCPAHFTDKATTELRSRITQDSGSQRMLPPTSSSSSSLIRGLVRNANSGNSLVAQWLGFSAFIGLGLIPVRELRSHESCRCGHKKKNRQDMKQPQCPLTDEWVKENVTHPHTGTHAQILIQEEGRAICNMDRP